MGQVCFFAETISEYDDGHCPSSSSRPLLYHRGVTHENNGPSVVLRYLCCPSQAVAEHYIMNHEDDPLYLPVMTYHLLQARVSTNRLPTRR